MTYVELLFRVNPKFRLKADKVRDILNKRLELEKIPFVFAIHSITVMSKWLSVIVEVPRILEVKPYVLNLKFLAISLGGFVMDSLLDYGVRFLTYEVHGLTSSLVYHKDWRKEKVALCVIAKDEEPHVADFMKCVEGWFDDIVVGVDTRTVDSTWDRFAERGARCFYIDWEDHFGEFRNRTMKFVAPEIDWVFWLDVDEYPEDRLLENLKGLVQTKIYDAYSFIRVNLETKTEERVVRLFRRSKGKWEGRVHESVSGIDSKRICETDFKIFHIQRWIKEGGSVAEERNAFYRKLENMDSA